ncbi:MAG: hypothetical protein QN178_16240, partial [Armatimonadota bacterium]|nr:hypothetical protein [Armatimonadota bacterium]
FEPHHPGVRIDSGVRTGQQIPLYYDPILSKIIAWAPDRPAAIRRMQRALAEYTVLGPKTNLDYLGAIIAHPGFAAGDLSTAFLEEHLRDWRPREASHETFAIAAAVVSRAQVAGAAGRATPVTGARDQGAGPHRDPWDRLSGWRLA